MNRKHFNEEELTCKPLDTYQEILEFLQNPPPWRTLCKEITPHSKTLIKNSEINPHRLTTMEMPQTFCHFNGDTEDVKRHDEKKLPKTLVCHDMANGYHDDSFIDGTGNFDAYTFYNWAGIDIFCYFSHHLITIPPLSWINVGHAHGVKVIGTIITEWADGAAFWDKILVSEFEYQNFASALVAIAKTLKFDGWLLNIENKIAMPEVLLEFVRYLHETLHQELTDPVLIWYDSVTVTGNLSWQNGLNEKNKAFFDVCDGIFTNYSWSESDIKSSVEVAGERLTDLYIGIDVWGRNFYGGGQFNTAEAVKVAYSYGCSLAIFAPAWTHEAMSLEKCDVNAIAMAGKADKWSTFILRDRAFWGSLWSYLNTRVPGTLPFQTSFCRGQGKKRRLYGEVICPVPWYNLRHQQYQPNSAHGPHGYILSTLDNILQIAQRESCKDEAYQDSFISSRMELHSSKSRELSLMSNKDSSTAVDDVEELSEQSEKRSKTVKRKMQDAFKQIFRLKSRKRGEGPIDNDLDETYEPETSQRSKSTVQMSVNIKLGQGNEKIRYGLASVEEEKECLEVYLDDSFTGGSCLCINPSDLCSTEHRLSRLFHCDFECKDSLICCVVTKTLSSFKEQYLNIKLYMRNVDDEEFRVVLVGRDLPQAQEEEGVMTGVVNLYPINTGSQETFRVLQKYILLNHPMFYVPVENCYDWKVWYYQINLPGTRITSVNCRTALKEGPILLGYFGLCEKLCVSE